MRRVVYHIFLLLFVITARAEEVKDTIMVHHDTIPDPSVLQNFAMQGLDSMINSWYIENSLPVFINDSSFLRETTSGLPADSVLKEQLASIQSAVDLPYNQRVKAYLRVYLEKDPEKLARILGQANFYFPIIEETLDRYNLPLELKYMAVIESALNPVARSRAGATGLWQFMYGTGKLYGLEISSYVDERKDVLKSTDAAARFLTDLYKMFGDWTLVIAAYNCGPGNVKKAIRRTGGRTNYWEIYYYLPRETRGYVPAFIAATYAFHYYDRYNISPIDCTLPLSTDTVFIHNKLHLKQVSEVLNLPISLVRNLNPQYKLDVVPASKKEYYIVLPLNTIDSFIEREDSVLAYKADVFFDPNRVNQSPTTNKYYGAPPKNSVKLYYKVKSGDNLGYIASWYNVRISDLRYWNNIHRNLIRVGQKLKVYVPQSKKDYYSRINYLSFSEKQASIGKSTTMASNSTPESKDSDYIYYTVKSGDSLWTIAQRFEGVSSSDIERLNGIKNTHRLKPGQQLKIKRK